MKQKIFEVGKKAYTFNQARYEEDMGRCVITAVYNNAKDIYTWTSSMTGYRASNIFPNDAVFAHKGSSLINDEVIIYREEQLTIQYLIELQI